MGLNLLGDFKHKVNLPNPDDISIDDKSIRNKIQSITKSITLTPLNQIIFVHNIGKYVILGVQINN